MSFTLFPLWDAVEVFETFRADFMNTTGDRPCKVSEVKMVELTI